MHSFPQIQPGALNYAIPAPESQDETQSAARKIAFWFGVGLVFVRFSMLNELFSYIGGHNFYLLYVFGIPALVGLVVSGGIARVLRERAGILWLCFGAWAVIAIPFSIWRGGSAHTVWPYWKSELLMMFVIGGIMRTWRECRVVMLTIAAAAAVNIVSFRLFGQVDMTGRRSLDFGTVANANDFAAHLLMVLPFLVWVSLSSKSRMLRLAALGGLGYGIYFVLASGSRGALVALAVDIMFFTFTARRAYRVGLWLLAPLIVIIAITVLPSSVVNRLASFSSSQSGASEEALGSSEARQTLLRDSIICALRNPVFGIGPGQFVTYEGTKDELQGTGAYWHNAHNSFAQAASECGIPALLLYVAAIWSSWHLLKVVGQHTSRNPQLLRVTNAIFCIRLAMIGFCTAVFFLNFTYTFYLPAMTGLAIAVASAVHVDRNRRKEVPIG
jgi:O-antigen ligase